MSICRYILGRLHEVGIPLAERGDQTHAVYPDLPEVRMYRLGLISSINDERIRALPAGQSIVLPPSKGTTTWIRPA